jgi:ACS family sodium-dependent inorganic phosphate cotransporter
MSFILHEKFPVAWPPSYFEMALGLNVQESSFLTLIPYVAVIAMTPVVSGSAVDYVVFQFTRFV